MNRATAKDPVWVNRQLDPFSQRELDPLTFELLEPGDCVAIVRQDKKWVYNTKTLNAWLAHSATIPETRIPLDACEVRHLQQLYASTMNVSQLMDERGASLEAAFTLLTQTNQLTKARIWTLVEKAVVHQNVTLLHLLYQHVMPAINMYGYRTPVEHEFLEAVDRGMSVTTQFVNGLYECVGDMIFLPAVDDWIILHCDDVCGFHAELRRTDVRFLAKLWRAQQEGQTKTTTDLWCTLLCENQDPSIAIDFMQRTRSVPPLWEALYMNDDAFAHIILQHHKPTWEHFHEAIHETGFTLVTLGSSWKKCYTECAQVQPEPNEEMEEKEEHMMLLSPVLHSSSSSSLHQQPLPKRKRRQCVVQ